MNDKKFKLTTGISKLNDLDGEWVDKYDDIYLGDPFCGLLKDNLIENKDHLKKAIDIIHSKGKKAYLSTYVEPKTEDMEGIRSAIGSALDFGIDGIEAYNVGTLNVCKKNYPEAVIHINSFIPIFNSACANIMSEKYNVNRIVTYYELTLDEIEKISIGLSVELEITVHGLIPLGYAETCMLNPDAIENKIQCSGMCYANAMLRHEGMSLAETGRVTSTGKEMGMFTHLDKLKKISSCFRIESRFRDVEYRDVVGKIYKDILSGRPAEADGKIAEILQKYSKEGLCNGYFFGLAGTDFVR